MKAKKLISFALCLCMILSSICAVSFTVSAEETETSGYFYDNPTLIKLDNDNNATSGEPVLGNFGEDRFSAETSAIGGKAEDDTYGKYLSGTGYIEPTIYFKDGAVSDELLSKKYFVVSFNVYGAVKNNIRAFIRWTEQVTNQDGKTTGTKTNKPIYAAITPSALTDNQWNKIALVYNTTDKKGFYFLNGIKSAETDISASLPQEKCKDFRVVVGNSTSKGVENNFYIDDISIYAMNDEPGATTAVSPNTTISGTYALYAPGAKVSAVTADNAAVRVYDSTLMTQKKSYNYLSEGDIIVTENATKDYGYYTVKYANDGVLYAQGQSDVLYSYKSGVGVDKVVDENATFNGVPMTKITTGTSDGVQAYYQCDWKKATVENKPRYLVAESDFAFDAGNPCDNFFMSTNGGSSLGTQIKYSPSYNEKILHMIWIYDTKNGTYSQYLEGKTIVDNEAVNADFAAGSKTNIRFGIGSDKGVAKTGYIANYVVYETDNAYIETVGNSIESGVASITIKNDIVARTVTVVLAQYDESGNIAAVDYKSAKVEADGTITAELALANDRSVWCYVVDNLGNLKPYCAPITIEQ